MGSGSERCVRSLFARALPWTQHDGIWKIGSRYEGWYALGPRLFDEHLDRLKDAVVSVLRERDPKFELPPEERYAASIHGKVPEAFTCIAERLSGEPSTRWQSSQGADIVLLRQG